MWQIKPFWMGKISKCYKNCVGGMCGWYSLKFMCRRYVCWRCGRPIETGSKAIMVTFQTTKLRTERGTRTVRFHLDCWLEQFLLWIDTQYARVPFKPIKVRIPKEPKPKMAVGRPRKYTDSALVNKLRTLLSYHRRLGHQEKVAELERQIEEVGHVQQVSGTNP